jgi:hypothetical protein
MLSDKNIQEIFRAIAKCEELPSQELLEGLSKCTQKTANYLKEVFVEEYKDYNDSDDDPYAPVSMIRG